MARHRLIVVSDRWDSLGGRLVSIANARAVATALGADFGFVWPRRGDTIDYPASALFSESFCDRYQLETTALDAWSHVDGRELLKMTLAEASDRFATLELDTAVFISQPFTAERFHGESAEAAAQRVRAACDTLEFGPEAAAIRSMIRHDVGSPATTLHARFGDIVAGAWAQWVPRDKFRPVVFFELAATQHSSDGPIVAVSDTPEIVNRLRERVSTVRGVGDLSPGYLALTGPARDWADLFTLWSSQLILAPSISAFSRFAALASGGQLFDVLGAVPPERRVATMLAAVRSESVTTHFDARMRARELCYLLDSDSGELSATTRRRLAAEARRADPGYVGAWTREASALAAAGHPVAAVRAASRAVELATPNRVHDDPGLDAEASLVATSAVAAVCGHSWRRKRTLRALRVAAAAASKRRPWQMHQAEIGRAVEYLTRLVEAVVASGSTRWSWRHLGRNTLEVLTPAGSADRLPLDMWHDHDTVLAMLERVTLWLVDLLGTATLARRGPHPGEPATAVRELDRSSNGVRWIEVTCDRLVTTGAVLVEHRSLPAPLVGVRGWDEPTGEAPRYLVPLVPTTIPDVAGGGAEEWTVTPIEP